MGFIGSMFVITLEATPARLRELVAGVDMAQIREAARRQAAAAQAQRPAAVLTPIVARWHAAFLMAAYGDP